MFSVYVKKSTQRTLTDVNMCDRFSATSYKNYRNITCTETLTGDQIVITANSTLGRLVVYEIQVYGKFIFLFYLKNPNLINDIAFELLTLMLIKFDLIFTMYDCGKMIFDCSDSLPLRIIH